MSSKAILVLCAQALLIQTAFSQCPNHPAIDASGIGPYGRPGFGLPPGIPGSALAYDGLAGQGFAGRGLSCNGGYAPAIEFTATSGGSLPVTSSSAIAPTGISVKSENVIEGALSVAGELPFVGTTGMEGALPAAGAGAVNHACGDGVTAMVSEASIAPGAVITPAAALAPTAGLGLSGFGPTGFGATGFGPTGFGATGFGPTGFGATGFGAAGLGAAGFGATGLGAAGLGPAGFGPSGFGISPSNRLGLGGCSRGNLY